MLAQTLEWHLSKADPNYTNVLFLSLFHSGLGFLPPLSSILFSGFIAVVAWESIPQAKSLEKKWINIKYCLYAILLYGKIISAEGMSPDVII